MDVLWVTRGSIERREPRDLGALIERDDGFVWVDVPECDAAATRILSEVFGFRPHSVQECLEPSLVPKVHTHADHVFIVLHGLESGAAGELHRLELDQFVGERFLITVHGPLGDGASLDAALRETRTASRRLESGHLRPKRPAELAYAIVSLLTARLEAHVSGLAKRIDELERSVLKGHTSGDPEERLEEMFRIRHELLTVKTLATQSREVFARRLTVAGAADPERAELIRDVVDQYERLASVCHGEQEFLDGVVDYYQSQTNMKMNIAMERLALIAAIVLPVTAVASIYGMNIIVNQDTDFLHVVGVLAAMAIVSLVMLRWAKRHGWW